MDKGEIEVCAARKEDMVAVYEMIQELADFEKMPDGPKISASVLQRDGFETSPAAFSCVVARACGGPMLGYALYYPTYSTWKGRALMLEDLYVRPQHRRRGLGDRLFRTVAQEAVRMGCARMDFHVLEWNPARAFYEARGAVDLTRAERWLCYQLSGDALRNLAHTHNNTLTHAQ